ncbi:MAG: DUF3379 domain-containing protein [Verrucomicrobia bacterium]|nr:DUF3379 domain-containing protein [Verrucomicrobiota bacterium]
MKPQQVKFILRSHRADLTEGEKTDSTMRAALDAAAADPELNQWFEQDQATDARLREALSGVEPREGLREAILAGLHTQKAEQAPLKTRRRSWLSAAAGIAALVVFSLGWLMWNRASRPATFAHYEREMTAFLNRGFTLDFIADKLPEISSWLTSNGTPEGYNLPDPLNRLQSIGCRTLEWRGEAVALVCFHLASGRELHVFAIRRTAFEDRQLQEQPAFGKEGIWTTAFWQRDGWTYLYASQAGPTELQRLLPTPHAFDASPRSSWVGAAF